MIYPIVLILFVLIIGVIVFFNHPQFGSKARGKRLLRIQQSANYRNGKFHNLHYTPQITSESGKIKVIYNFLFEKRLHSRPTIPLPSVKTNLHLLEKNKNLLIWFGHSSYFLQNSGKKILIDPVFDQASPVWFVNLPFKGTQIYEDKDMPDIDYLVITHDHWDHLDYKTIKKLKPKIKKIICPLGVGAHFEYWGFNNHQIIELDWNENNSPEANITFYCLPARHFSGRTMISNTTLWASFMLKTSTQTIYIGGDSGYDTHFAQIAQQFPNIDVAILENGQYNKDWKYIHMMPEDLIKALTDLKAKKVFAFHNSKFNLSKHSWFEPLNNLLPFADSFHITMPIIGEVVYLDNPTISAKKWWENIP